jgi:hypothetical protein
MVIAGKYKRQLSTECSEPLLKLKDFSKKIKVIQFVKQEQFNTKQPIFEEDNNDPPVERIRLGQNQVKIEIGVFQYFNISNAKVSSQRKSQNSIRKFG